MKVAVYYSLVTMMICSVLFVLSVGLASASFSFSDCNKPGAKVHIKGLSFPQIISNGGRYRLQANVTVDETLPGCSLVSQSVQKLNKNTNQYEAFPKCFDGLGSCPVSLCQEPGYPPFNPLFYACTGSQIGSLAAGDHQIDEDIFFPGLDGKESATVDGQYKGTVSLMNTQNQEIGCWNLSYQIEILKSPCA